MGIDFSDVRVVDLTPLRENTDPSRVAGDIARACRECGFFYSVGHGVDEALQARLDAAARRFFARPAAEKMAIAMARGGRAWRGYFPVGGELTSGKPDLKEGLYFGRELGPDDPRVQAGLPLHGANLFPDDMPDLRDAVLAYLDAMTALGHTLMAAIALSLGLPRGYFADRYTADPLVLFRIFSYPPDHGVEAADARGTAPRWGVGEHTDYGLLTILKQDDAGGLEVKSRTGWVPAPPLQGSFVCNIGDMLDRMTGGHYRSTPHRVRNLARRARLSFPFFFDPAFDARIQPIEMPDAAVIASDREERWDHASVHEFSGTYGDYVLGKVSKVFPQLRREVGEGS